MKMMGVTDISELGPRFVSINPSRSRIYDLSSRPNTAAYRSTLVLWSEIFSTAALG
jgi:hypothetical protein